MAERRIRVVLEANAAPLIGGLRTAAGAVDGFGKSVKSARADYDRLADTSLVVGGGLAAGLGLATREAIQWESAWAGVTKTIDGTPQQYAELEAGLRGLSKTLPATHEELAGVAEAAGQLGIARDDILGFTETAVALGESTNLTAEEAATSLAKISNVMGTASREGVAGYEMLGDTLVALGNAGASTEADIVSMAQRLAGVGNLIGATEGEVLAVSNAMSSVGIESELGGGAMQRVWMEMHSAVRAGGDDLAAFAEVAGTSASDFAKQWESSPVEATQMFVDGLSRINESGGDVSAVLTDVGLSGTQNASVLLRMAGASDVLTDSLRIQGEQTSKGGALMEEASKRYATTESRMRIAQNSIRDAAIDMGSVIGPAAAEVAEKLAAIANAFVQLPAPAQKAITGIAGVGSAALLLGGATIKAVGFAQDMSASLEAISARGPKAAAGVDKTRRAMVGLGKAAGALAAVSITGSVLGELDSGPSAMGIEQLKRDLIDTEGALDSVNARMAELAVFDNRQDSSIRSVGDALRYAFDPGTVGKIDGAMGGFFENFTGNNYSNVAVAGERLTELDTALAQLASGGSAGRAAQIFDEITKTAEAQGISVDELRKKFPQYAEALAAAESQAKLSGDAAGDAAGGIDELGSAAGGAAEDIGDLADAIDELGGTLLAEQSGAIAYEAALDDMAASIKENGRTLDISTEAGRANKSALIDLAEATQEWASATLRQTGDVEAAQGVLDKGRGKYISYAQSMGMSRKEATALADELFRLPADVQMSIDMKGGQAALSAVEGVAKSLAGIDSTVATPEVREQGAEPSKARVVTLMDSITTLSGKTVNVNELGSGPSMGRVLELDGAIFGLSGKTVKVTEIGSTASGERVVQLGRKIYAVPNKTAQVNANVGGVAEIAGLNAAIASVRDKTVTIRAVAVGASISALGFADGGVWQGPRRYADGGVDDERRRRWDGSLGGAQPQIRPAGGRGVLWAEEGAGPWEGFVSGHPAKRSRSRAVASEIVARLGGDVDWGAVTAFASGGVRSYRWGQISARRWEELMAQGWRGRAGDREERIYAPAGSRATRKKTQKWGQDSYALGEISDSRWKKLLSQGWRGRAGDGEERIYRPAKKAWQHSPEYLRKQAKWAAQRQEQAARAQRMYRTPVAQRNQSSSWWGGSDARQQQAFMRQLEGAMQRATYQGSRAGTQSGYSEREASRNASAAGTPRGRAR